MGAPTLLRLATAGSVDDGKSTLVGRLLHDSKSVLADQLDAVERVSRDRGLAHADLALLTDGLRAEREQGITIDVAYRYFATADRSFILADCPGHVQYTRNTVTGASTADAVVLLVDARKGVLEQTRRHLAVAALLRVPHVVVAVNKIDLVDFDAEVYARVSADLAAVATDLGLPDLRTVPVSALEGDNVVDRSTRTDWYDGPSLLEVLETLPVADDPDTEEFRFPVQLTLRPQEAARDAAHREYRGYAGQIASGVVRVGDEVVVLPSGRRTTVAGIDTADGELAEAFAPMSVALRLTDDIDVARGRPGRLGGARARADARPGRDALLALGRAVEQEEPPAAEAHDAHDPHGHRCRRRRPRPRLGAGGSRRRPAAQRHRSCPAAHGRAARGRAVRHPPAHRRVPADRLPERPDAGGRHDR